MKPISKKVVIDNLRVHIDIGILDHEIGQHQPIEISVEAEISTDNEGADDISETLDYRTIREIIIQESNSHRVNLLETLCLKIGSRLIDTGKIRTVRTRARKPNIFSDCESVAVEVALAA
jgi:dihydroneopterin aldolase